MSLTPQWLDELRSRITLSTLIGRSIKVTKAGREYKACCPFHNEKTPSFTINDEKGFYHCFGCSAHGDAIRWMTDQRGLGFMDAVKELASEAGMEVPAPDPRAAKKQEKRNSLYDVMTAAQDFFVQQLSGMQGSHAREYLKSRGMKQETVQGFGFGYAPDNRGALKQALSHFDISMLIEAGLLISVDGKDPYDRFRGRLMIPIHDIRGRVIAFGGRILGDGEPKYLNSPDTPLFDKGRTLYNLDKASPASRQTGRVIVTEGYMDVIALAQAGYHDCVAPLGTAVTEQQIQMLWRMSEAPILCFDGDRAGQKAAVRASGRALPMLKPGHSLRISNLPPGQDPDDIVSKQGKSAFEKLLDNARALDEHIWQYERSSQSINTPEEKAGLKQRLNDHVNMIADPDIRSLYGHAFKERFDSLFTAPSNTYGKATFKRAKQPFFNGKKSEDRGYNHFETPPSDKARSISHNGSDILLQAILAGLLRHPNFISVNFEILNDIKSKIEWQQNLLDQLLEYSSGKERLETNTILTILDPTLYNKAVKLLRADQPLFAFSKNKQNEDEWDDLNQIGSDLTEAIRLFKQRPALDIELANASRRANLAENDEEFAKAYEDTIKIGKAKRNYDQRLAGLLQQDLSEI